MVLHLPEVSPRGSLLRSKSELAKRSFLLLKGGGSNPFIFFFFFFGGGRGMNVFLHFGI